MAADNPSDPVTLSLARLLDELRLELGDAATIAVEDRDYWRAVDLLPRRQDALAMSWTDFHSAPDGSPGDALQFTAGHQGGRWELGRDEDDLTLLIELVRSVLAGRVTEVFGPARSRVEITLSNGSREVQTGAQAPRGCLPLPGWPHRGHRIQYAPYL